MTRLSKYAWFVWAYNVFVILVGGYVRASGSGAGCGSHWPLCNGVVVPRDPGFETIIEFSHRITSGLAVVFIAILIIFIWRGFPRGHLLRLSGAFCAIFILTESLIGAGLVLFRLVEHNDSFARAFSMMAHLINTFLLLASLAITAWLLSFKIKTFPKISWKDFILYNIGVIGFFVLGASGAVAALGDTLFPANSLIEGIQEEFSATAHYLLRLRIWHPPIAIITGLYAGLIARRLHKSRKSFELAWLSKGLIGLIALQFALGVVNVWLLAPIWLQLVHLLMTVLIWSVYVLTGVAGWIASNSTSSIREENINNRIEQSAT